MLHQKTDLESLGPPGEARRSLRLLLRSFDLLVAGCFALLMALGFGFPLAPALVLGLGSGLLASTVCPVARRSGPTLVGALIAGLAAGGLAGLLGLQAWPEAGLVVSASLLSVKVARRTVRLAAKSLLRTL